MKFLPPSGDVNRDPMTAPFATHFGRRRLNDVENATELRFPLTVALLEDTTRLHQKRGEKWLEETETTGRLRLLCNATSFLCEKQELPNSEMTQAKRSQASPLS